MATLDFTPDKIAAIDAVLADAWKNHAAAQDADARDEAELSRAQRRMAARRRKRPDLVQPVEIIEDGESEVWFVTALADDDICAIGVCTARDGFTINNLSTAEAQRSFNAALLFVGLVVSETDTTKFFEGVEEAKEFYDDARNAQTSVALRLQILHFNPYLELKKKTASAKGLATIRLLPSVSKR